MQLNEYIDLNKQQVASEEDAFTERRYVQFFKYFRKDDKKILDIGCNTGRGGMTLSGLSPDLELTGLDIIEDRMQRIPAGIYERLLLGPADRIDAPGNSFDVAVAGEVIEHIDPTDVSNVLKELKRVLRPGGKLLLTTPNPRAPLVLLGHDAVLKEPSHVCLMVPSELKKRLLDCGYEKVQMAGSGKLTKYLPENFPLLSVFGSYLAVAQKPA
jgi:ubiquinone/menaquinone biosynthesis C-methylase UbiE